jgi:catalase
MVCPHSAVEVVGNPYPDLPRRGLRAHRGGRLYCGKVSDSSDLAGRLVTALNGVHGEHPGFRAAHARGSCARATFRASPEARELTFAAHMQGQDVPVTVRFSNGSGAPTRPDYASDGRGMAVKFHLPDGAAADMVGLTLGQFFVRTPEDFLEFLAATTPDPETRQPDLGRIDAFLQQHPETRAAVEAEFIQPHPASYLSTAFNGIHAFKVTNAAGESRFIRYRWEPEGGVQTIEREEARARGREYLQEDLRERLSGGTAAFWLDFSLAQPGDPLTDATATWPSDRQKVRVGRLTLDGMVDDQESDCEARVFDPTVVPDGIECSEDPILHARSRAYSVSMARRRGIRHPSSPADEPPGEEGEINPGGIKLVVKGDHPISVANVGGVLHAFDDLCTHRQCSLAQGTLEGPVVTCPCHGSQFDVTTGEVVRGPARETLQTYETRSDGSRVVVGTLRGP